MSLDFWTGLFELGGAFMLARNVVQLHRDKLVRGVHWMPTLFFFSWGIWNLYFYPANAFWWAFAGGIAIVSVNGVWFAQMLYYRGRENAGYRWVPSRHGVDIEGFSEARPFTFPGFWEKHP